MLYQSTKSFREMLGELYEPEWVGYDSYKDIMEVCVSVRLCVCVCLSVCLFVCVIERDQA